MKKGALTHRDQRAQTVGLESLTEGAPTDVCSLVVLHVPSVTDILSNSIIFYHILPKMSIVKMYFFPTPNPILFTMLHKDFFRHKFKSSAKKGHLQDAP